MNQSVLTHRVFVCAYPEPEAAPGLAAAQQRLRTDFGVESGMTAVERLHMSLVGLGEDALAPSRRWVEDVGKVLAGVRMPPFRIALNTLGSFRASRAIRPVVLTGEDGVIGVSMLRDAIASALRAEGVRHGVATTPHVTLAWSSTVVVSHLIEPVTWLVREFVLIDSLQGAGRHEVLGRWLLTAPEGRPRPG